MPTQLGAYDAIGEIVPNLTLIDADGSPLSLLDQGDGLIVVSLSTVWCGPCNFYSSKVNDIEAAVQEVRFIDILLEGSVPGVDATTSDAAAWRDKFGVSSPVVTSDNTTTLSDIYLGFNVTAFPAYYVIDSATGRIVDTFVGADSAEVFIQHFKAVADEFYGTLPSLDLVGTNGADTLDGSRGQDTLAGAGGDDVLNGYSGDDLLDGGAGHDTLAGGRGNDVYRISDGRLDQETIVEARGDGQDTLLIAGVDAHSLVRLGATLPANVERLAISDTLGQVTFDGGSNVSNVWDFQFTMDSATAEDIKGIEGGAQNDTINVSLRIEGGGDGAASVTIDVDGGAGNDVVTVDSSDSLTSDNSFVSFRVFGGAGADILTGGRGADFLQGDSGDDHLLGQAGNDVLTGGAGDDILEGGAGNDILEGGAGHDTLRGGAGSDTYVITDKFDVIEGEPGGVAATGSDIQFALQFFGMSIDDFYASPDPIPSQHADQQISIESSPFSGFDWIELQTLLVGPYEELSGDDGTPYYLFAVDISHDLVQAEISYSLVNAPQIEDLTLTGKANIDGFGNDRANTILGNEGNNRLEGHDGNDILNGLAGKDVLVGGAGKDVMTGGAGNDQFVFKVGEANGDTITDFAGNGGAIGDTLLFVGYGAGATFAQVDANHWQINYGAGLANHEVITIGNAATIHASDFLFA